MRGVAAFRLILATALATLFMFLLYGAVAGVLLAWAFPEAVLARLGAPGYIYGFGLVFPYLTIASPVAFLIGFPLLAWVVFRKERSRIAVDVVSGAVAWSGLSFVLLVATIVSPPFAHAELDARATWIFVLGFAVFQAVVGAIAGRAAWATQFLFQPRS